MDYDETYPEQTTCPHDTLDTAMTWAHDQGDYTDEEFATGLPYLVELEMMKGSWDYEYPNIDGAIELVLEKYPNLRNKP